MQYGAFALAYVTYGFALQASRGLATDPLLVRYSGKDISTWRRAVSSAAGTATTVGLVGGGFVLVMAALLSGPTRMAFLALGVTLPLLMLQDSWRFAFFALGRGGQAFLNDSVWAVSLIIGLVYLRSAGLSSVFWYVFAWGAAAGVGAAVGLLQARVIPKVSGTREWLSRQRDLGFRYLVEGASYSAASLVRNYGVGLILGLTALGYIQAANTLMGPFQVILYGLALATLPEAIRILHRSPRHMMLFCVLCSVGLTLVALGWGVTLLVVLPRGLGQWLLGPIWRPTYELVLPTTFFMMGGCVSAGAATYMRARGGPPERSCRDLHLDLLPGRLSRRGHCRRGRRSGSGCRRCFLPGIAGLLVAAPCRVRETKGIPIAEKDLSSDTQGGALTVAGSTGAGGGGAPRSKSWASRHAVQPGNAWNRCDVGSSQTPIFSSWCRRPMLRPPHNGEAHRPRNICRSTPAGWALGRDISDRVVIRVVSASAQRGSPGHRVERSLFLRDSPPIDGQTSRFRCICHHARGSV